MTRPKISLRDLFAVLTIVALALGWWLDRYRLAREKAELARNERRASQAVTILTATLEDDGYRVWINEDGAVLLDEPGDDQISPP